MHNIKQLSLYYRQCLNMNTELYELLNNYLDQDHTMSDHKTTK